jgi:hypothetical protein
VRLQSRSFARWNPRLDTATTISDALHSAGFGYGAPNAVSNLVDYAKFRSRSHDAVICVYDAAGNVIETHEHAVDFKEW